MSCITSDIDIARRYLLLSSAEKGMLTQKQAAIELGLSYSHTKRLVNKLRRGELWPNQERAPRAANRLPENIRNMIVAVKQEDKERSNPLIAEIIFGDTGVRVHPNTIRNILVEKQAYYRCHMRRTPSSFEMKAFGQMVHVGVKAANWFKIPSRIYLIVAMDDFSRAVLSARFFDSVNTYNTMLVIREAIERYGVFRMVFGNNDSRFRTVRHGQSRFFNYRVATLNGEVVTQLHRALLELGICLLSYLPKNYRAKLKTKRLFRQINKAFSGSTNYASLDEINSELQMWIERYNCYEVNDDIACRPISRFAPSALRPLLGENLDDIFCLKTTRTVSQNNAFCLNRKAYTLPRRHYMQGLKVCLNVHPGKTIRVWHEKQFTCEIPTGNGRQNVDIRPYIPQLVESVC